MSTQPQLDFMRPLGKKAANTEVVRTGRQLKQRGMQKAAAKHSEELKFAKEFAIWIAQCSKRDITIEDVRDSYRAEWTLGNAAGSVFKGPEWEWVGFKQATRPEAHARILRVWRLKRC